MNDALSLNATRRDAIAKLKSCSGFESELQTSPMSFHLDSSWSDTFMPLRERVRRTGNGTEYWGWLET